MMRHDHRSQMTVSGLFIAALFFFISASKPLPKLSSQRPTTNLFSWLILTTIAIQFLIHFAYLILVRKMTLPYIDMSLSYLLSI